MPLNPEPELQPCACPQCHDTVLIEQDYLLTFCARCVRCGCSEYRARCRMEPWERGR